MNLLVLTQKVNREDAILGFFTAWLECLARRVDRLSVITLEEGAHDLPRNTEVISLGKDRGVGRPAMIFSFNRALWRICRKERPDVILAHMVPRYVLYALPLAFLHRIPIDLWYTHKGVDRTLRMAHPFIRHVFTASAASFRLPSRKRIVTGHGIDTAVFRPKEGAAGQGIITVGRITPSKDQEVLIEALALLKGRLPEEALETRIVGEPLLEEDRCYMERMETLIRERSLEGRVRFSGPVVFEDMPDCYRSARVLVNASHTGSVDKVVLEAMAAGTLPLTCNESFIPLLGEHADRLVFEKNRPEDLARRLERLLSMEEEEERRLSAALREIVAAHHNLEALIDKIVERMKAGLPQEP